MQNLFFKRVLLVGFVLTMSIQSCTNLEEELYSDITADNFFKTDEEFIAALGQAYASFGGLGNHGNLWSLNEIASDELVITTKGGDWYDGGILINLHQHNFTSDNDFFNNAWGFLYGGINTANRLIFSFEKLGTPESKVFISELRAVRALWYFWAMDAFGNVPLVVDFTAKEAPANASRAEVYNFILSELNAVIPVLPTSKDSKTYGRMTKWAALAIRSKLYLNSQVYINQPKWAEAAADAQEIIDKGPFSLQSVYSENFAIRNGGSSENIMVYAYDKVFAGGFNWPMMTLHYASQGVYSLADQPWNGYSVVEEFYNSYIDAAKNPGPQGNVWKGLATAPSTGTLDKRLTNFVVGPQFNPDGSRAQDPGVDAGDPDGAPLNFTPQINQIFPNAWRQGGARIGKYEYEVGGNANMSNDFVIFRLGDVILTLAEAEFRRGNTAKALVLVNQIRKRAGVDAFSSLTLDQLFEERGREMFAEMTRRQDQIRFGKWSGTWWEKPSTAAKTHQIIFPIPKPQLNSNAKLKQNPGYN
jgi:hypothetical protein